MLKRVFVFGVAAIIILSVVGCSVANNEAEPTDTAHLRFPKALDPANMDPSVAPGDDFFRYANGGYLARLEIPEDRSSYDAFDILREDTAKAVHEVLADVAEDTAAQPGTIRQKIRDFYSTGMDVEKIDELGISPIQEELARIDALATKAELTELLSRFHKLGVSPFFTWTVLEDLKDNTRYRFYVLQSGTGLPDVEYYTKDDPRSQEIRAAYLEHLQAMFVLLGEDEQAAAEHAEMVMALETRLAENSRTRLELRNIPALYNPMSLQQLSEKAPAVEWSTYLTGLRDVDFGEPIVGMPEYFEAMSRAIEQASLDELKVYLRWQLIDAMASYLSTAFVNQNHEFFGAFLSGNPKIRPRWERVVDTTNGLLGEPVGQLYVERYFPPESKERMLELVANLKSALKTRLESNEWMGDETKEAALAKLAAMRVKIGYPDKWEDYSALEIATDSYASNVLRAQQFLNNKDLKKLGEPVDPDEWPLAPQIVNAGYSPLKNDITFPAGILQPPYFNPAADDAVNYGGIGVVIGHEMTHGFDDQGRRFDKNGNMVDWWTPEDEAEFNKRAQLLVEQYGAFSALDGVQVNGELTLGENIADFGGLTIAYQAYKASLEGQPEPEPIDGFTDDQRFFLSYAQLWRGKIRDEALRRQMVEDVHPWAEYRTNGAPFNVPEFYEIFQIPEDAKLARTAAQRPVIW